MYARVLAVAALFLAAACSSPRRPELPSPECTYNSDCPEDRVCSSSGTCTEACRADRDCGEGLLCQSGRCEAQPGVCRRDTDCAEGETCAVNGKCAKSCTASAECGEGFGCFGGMCLSWASGCGRDADCPPEHRCTAEGSCARACAAAKDCPLGQTCSAGACVAALPECASSADCTAPRVCGPTGTCVAQCAVDLDCGAGQLCNAGACELLPPQCTRNSDCPSGKACIAGACADACIDSRDCAVGAQCDLGHCTLPSVECLDAADCTGGKRCSPAGRCVSACSVDGDCQAGELCSASACVVSDATTATLAGSAEITGLSDHAGIEVVLRGPGNAKLMTASDGQFRFAGLPPGNYSLRLSAASTKEETVALEVTGKGGQSTAVPVVRFTPVGSIKGTAALLGTTSALGIQVVALGTGKGATTDGSGAWTIEGVAAGTYELVATYPGYTPARIPGVSVQRGAQTTAPALQLDPMSSGSGATFAFTSTPPALAYVGRPYVYTAAAGGAGVTLVTYSIVSGPPSMTIDPNSGAVAFTPTADDPGDYFVVIAARGGGSIVYQVYSLEVSTPFARLSIGGASDADARGGAIWVAEANEGATRISSGSTVSFESEFGALSGSIDSVEVVNGGAIGSVSFPGGTVGAATGPFGALSASWPGGVIDSVTPLDRYPVAGASLEGGVVAEIEPLDGDVVSDVSVPGGTADSFSDGRAVPSAVTAPTGVVTSVTATELTDAQSNWPTDALKTLCLTDLHGPMKFTITANTATTITIGTGDLTTLFAAGQRYFVAACSNRLVPYTVEDGAASFGNVVGKRADLYVGGGSLGEYAITANTTTSFTFSAPPSLYSALGMLPAAGFYILAETGGLAVTLTDSEASFGPVTTGQRVAFDGNNSGSYAVTATTPTTLTFTAPFGTAASFGAELEWRLTDSAGRTAVTLTLKSGGHTVDAYAGKYLYLDVISERIPILSNTAGTMTVNAPLTVFPVETWRQSRVAVVSASNGLPGAYVITDAAGGLTPNAWTGRNLVLVPATGVANTILGAITGNTAQQVTVKPTTTTCGGSNCHSKISQTRTAWNGARYSAGAGRTPATMRLRVQLSGATFAVDELIGRAVFLESQPSAPATVAGNTSDTLSLEVPFSAFPGWDGVLAGNNLVLSVGGETSTTQRWRVRLNDRTGGFTPNAWAGRTVVTRAGATGQVMSNDATGLDLSLTSSAPFAELSPGAPYALALPPASMGSGCGATAGWIPVRATLAGAALQPNSYQRLETKEVADIPVLSNDAGAAELQLCTEDFADFVDSLGLPAALETGGRVELTISDPAASHVPGALAGSRLALPGSSLGPVIAGNTANTLRFDLSSSELFSIVGKLVPGTRYMVADSQSIVPVVLDVDFPLQAGALAGRMVRLHNRDNSSSDRSVLAHVTANTATSLTLPIQFDDVFDLVQTGNTRFDWVTTSSGAVLRLNDASANLAPDSLKGRVLRVGGRSLEVVSNTATSITVASSDHVVIPHVRMGSGWTVYGLTGDWAARVLALDSGDALVGSDGGGSVATVWKLTSAKTGTASTRLSTALPLTAKAMPVLAGGKVGGGVAHVGSNTRVTDPSWSWQPGELAGALFLREYNGNWVGSIVLENTVNSLMLRGNIYSFSKGTPYAIHPMAVQVTGTTLTPDAYRGKKLWINGVQYHVRGNTADELQLGPIGKLDVTTLASLDGSPAFLLTGLIGYDVWGMAHDGGNGFWASTSEGVAHFDGTSWSNHALFETSTPAGITGQLTGFSTYGFLDSNAAFTPGALKGKRVVLSHGVFDIRENSAQELQLSIPNAPSGDWRVPLIGDNYTILEADGLTDAKDVSFAGGALWVANDDGLFRLAGGDWTFFSAANTESRPGAADRLPSGRVLRVAARSASEIWAAVNGRGAVRFDGTSWTQYTRAGTESVPGAGDGLVSNYVQALTLEPNAVWFSTDDGASKLEGTTWTTFGEAHGLQYGVYDVVRGLSNELCFATGSGLLQYVP